MTDREMLELAAKACGLAAKWVDVSEFDGLWLNGERSPDNSAYWDPRNNDGDSRRLQIACQLALVPFGDAMVAMHNESGRSWAERYEDHAGYSCSAARLAILRAAAAIGSTL